MTARRPTALRQQPGVYRPLEKRYRCPLCLQRSFYFKPNLDYHMQRRHGTDQQPTGGEK